jgi:hypothetical protein
MFSIFNPLAELAELFNSFAIGNARPLNLQQKCLENCRRILEHSATRVEDARMVAEIQLYSITLSVQSNSQRIQNDEAEFEEITQWKKEWSYLFGEAVFYRSLRITAKISQRTDRDHRLI